MRTVFLCVWLIFFTACQNSLTHEVYEYGDEFELTLGEEVRVGFEKKSVEFVDVLEDSRCPVNVVCFWAGNGKVQIRFASEQIQLNTYLEPHKTSIADINIELLGLVPYPEHSKQIDKDDYKIRLIITRE